MSAHPTDAPAPTTVRADGRAPDDLRPIRITRGWLDAAEGSVLVEFGNTRVLCAASFTAGVPRWRKGSGEGWVTAEYAMLPRATNTRNDRESVRGRIGGRTHEISRLIGRSLRAVIDVAALGENTIVVDCDVLQADGGTRTAAITGAYVALADAVAWGLEHGEVRRGAHVLRDSVSAVSVGIVDGAPLLDLPYAEDVRAETDMNVVVTGSGSFVEVQGTAEGAPFDRAELDALLDLALVGTRQLAAVQAAALEAPAPGHPPHPQSDAVAGDEARSVAGLA
ncbi:ribonuclease PH [Beutenbergia cavernae DSM 12333]|uniref:Ribonuclease PH n=1 Tax=Beutenbergia cavernae (strain ATCC BAA-8 / DSM 12333 / CCUG 43141 / JCM 11478 / NBRC 16432 / NCIMB 13614 / HKI 0122) TaxID=471853 RepID=C5BY79_BEUC1|nr:ribonuclease PH [Beutenbergia cavernae]ACQ80979.1 ribonuclease PH [Beutenbergia cavernae DSM 12333]